MEFHQIQLLILTLNWLMLKIKFIPKMKSFLKYTLTSLLLISVLAGCDKEYNTIEELDQQSIEAYIQQNSLVMLEYNETGVQYQVSKQGRGKPLDFSKPVAAIFNVRSLDGKFVATDTMAVYNRYSGLLGYLQPNASVQFADKEVVPNLVKSVLVNEGGIVRFILPSKLAYGRNDVTSVPGYSGTEIPGNSSLDVTVELLREDKLEQYADEEIQAYLQKNSLSGFTKTASGIYYKIGQVGTGSPITIDSTITVEYTRRLLDGKVVETATSTNSLTQRLSGLIDAWKEVVPLIKQGGSLRLITPYTQAYRKAEALQSGVAPFLQMDFEIKVTDVK